MTRILRVDPSIRGRASLSRRIADLAVDRLRAKDPAATVTLRDLSKGLPAIGAAWLEAAAIPSGDRDDDQRALMGLSDTLLAELRAAETVVIGLPVYNFGVPATLKSWFDHITRRGETFDLGPDGPVGLMSGKRAVICFASDMTPVGSALDHATPHLRQMLGFIGITQVEILTAPDLAAEASPSAKAA